MNPLNLSVPQQHDYTDPTVERDVARLQDWLSNLPLMDVIETVRLVHAALSALNEQKLDHARRFRFLEIYRATVLRLFVTLDPLHLRQLSLSKTQRREAVKGLAGLFLSMAGGYKLIVVLLYSSLVPGKPAPELFGLAINRALEQLGYAMLDSYRFYRTPQPFMMAESHQLYRLARHHGLLDSSIHESEENRQPLTTAMLYHTSMLLSLTDPFRLSEGEVGLLFDVLLQVIVAIDGIPQDPIFNVIVLRQAHARETVSSHHHYVDGVLVEKLNEFARDMTVQHDQSIVYPTVYTAAVFLRHQGLDLLYQRFPRFFRHDPAGVGQRWVDGRRQDVDNGQIGRVLFGHFECGGKCGFSIFGKIGAADNSFDRHVSSPFLRCGGHRHN